MRATMDEVERPYDGCGTCLLGVRRLSRVKAATTSPERQREDVLAAAASVGGHIVDRADDWEVSGATAPMTRPRLGPWLRDEKGRYDGLVASAGDRLNTGYKMRDEGKLLVSYDTRASGTSTTRTMRTASLWKRGVRRWSCALTSPST